MDSRQARVDLDRLESAVGDLPKVLGTTEEVSPDGRVALVRVQYPEIGELAVSDLDSAQGRPGGVEGVVVAATRSRRRPLLQLRAAARQRGRGARPGGRGADPAAGLRVTAGRRAADRGWHCSGCSCGASSLSLLGLLDRHPELGAGHGGHGRAGRRHRLRAVPALPPPGVPRRGRAGRGGGRPLPGHRRAGRRLRRRHRRRGDPRAGLRRAPVRLRRRCRASRRSCS